MTDEVSPKKAPFANARSRGWWPSALLARFDARVSAMIEERIQLAEAAFKTEVADELHRLSRWIEERVQAAESAAEAQVHDELRRISDSIHERILSLERRWQNYTDESITLLRKEQVEIGRESEARASIAETKAKAYTDESTTLLRKEQREIACESEARVAIAEASAIAYADSNQGFLTKSVGAANRALQRIAETMAQRSDRSRPTAPGLIEFIANGCSARRQLSFSIVINTDGRVETLKRTLSSLKHLKYGNFEVCVVAGPTRDGTREYLESLGSTIKLSFCDKRNLSQSRNIGIALATGEVVAFIDDDAIPEPEWLCDLATSFEDEEVAGVGGFVYDQSGVGFQSKYVTANRLGYALDWNEPAPHLNFPYSRDFPHLLGTNCSFRRAVLLEVGGFDEEYEYFLDETDVVCRVNDAGYQIIQRPDAFVHHKCGPSDMRDVQGTIRNWYPLIKNRTYFGLRNGLDHHSLKEVLEAAARDVRFWEKEITAAASKGIYSPEDVRRFHDQVEAAVHDGCLRASTKPKLLTNETLDTHRTAFTPYRPTLRPEDQRVFCFVSQAVFATDCTVKLTANFDRLARGLAAEGHHVHVLMTANGSESVDYEDGVWIYRVTTRDFDDFDLLQKIKPVVSRDVWNYSQSMFAKVNAINERRAVDLVYCSLSGHEAIAFAMNDKYQLMVTLETTPTTWLTTQPGSAMELYATPSSCHLNIETESLILEKAQYFHAITELIAEDLEAGVCNDFPREKFFGGCISPQKIAPELFSTKQGRKSTGAVDSLMRVASRLAVSPDEAPHHT